MNIMCKSTAGRQLSAIKKSVEGLAGRRQNGYGCTRRSPRVHGRFGTRYLPLPCKDSHLLVSYLSLLYAVATKVRHVSHQGTSLAD